ncbi:hypothetical protein QM084_25935 [Klebsiella pneumoniae]|uniref:hypothetical protein n=1 Tax=Klebsiella pneumoniae TaxID=573 RepID=UPI00294A6195|nr:hypothetical protein [Klebsiella pneumoniae]MDV5598684.1 hypothetical protein [Klebsiella pneumoniae]
MPRLPAAAPLSGQWQNELDDVNKSIYLEGKSPQPHRWEPAVEAGLQYDHPLWKRYADLAAGAGHGGMDWFVIHAFVEALKAKAPMPIDIYDALA